MNRGSRRAQSVVLIAVLGSGFAIEAALMSLLQLYLADSTSLPLLISVVTSLRYAGVLVGSVLWGSLFDVHRTRRLLIWLFLATSLGVGVLAARPSIGRALCIAPVVALGLSGLAPAASALGTRSSRSLSRGRRVSLFTTARSVGMLIGGATVGIFLQSVGYAWSFALIAMLALAAVGALLCIRLPTQTTGWSRRQSIGSLLKLNLSGLYCGVMLRQMATAGGISMVLAYMLSLGLPPATITLVSASRFLLEVLTMYPFGSLADRFGRKPVLLIGFGGSVLAPLLFSLSGNLAILAVGFIAAGTGFGALYVGSIAHIGDSVPRERHGSMLGLFESVRGLGGILGPILAGATVPLLGYRGMFVVMAATATLGLLLVEFSSKGNRTSINEPHLD